MFAAQRCEHAANGSFSDAAATEAFDEPLTKGAVLAIAGQFIGVVSVASDRPGRGSHCGPLGTLVGDVG